MLRRALIEGFALAIVAGLLATPAWILLGYEQAVAVFAALTLLGIVFLTLRDISRL